MTLTGCLGLGVKQPPIAAPDINIPLPDISVQDAQECPDPRVRAGEPALDALVNNRLALGICRRRHQRVVDFYRDVQAGHVDSTIEGPNEGMK